MNLRVQKCYIHILKIESFKERVICLYSSGKNKHIFVIKDFKTRSCTRFDLVQKTLKALFERHDFDILMWL